MKADLHLHSTRSDGSWHRASVLQQAAAVGLTHIAFTEHDDTGYHDEALALAAPLGLRVLCGTELAIEQAGIPALIPVEMCYLGWQESLTQLAALVEPEIPNE